MGVLLLQSLLLAVHSEAEREELDREKYDGLEAVVVVVLVVEEEE